MQFKREFSAGGIVYKKTGRTVEWLIIEHSKYHGWVFPKGHIGDKIRNEKPPEAAIREVREEGGIEAKIVSSEPVFIEYMFRFQDYLIKKKVYYFLMEYVSGDIQNHDFEVSDIKFVPADEAKNTLSYKNDQEAFEKMLHRYESLEKHSA